MIGPAISHYEVLEKFGDGGMGHARCWRSPGGGEIAPDNARSLPRFRFLRAPAGNADDLVVFCGNSGFLVGEARSCATVRRTDKHG